MSIQYKPTLTAHISEYSSNNCAYHLHLNLNNVGRGEATSVSIQCKTNKSEAIKLYMPIKFISMFPNEKTIGILTFIYCSSDNITFDNNGVTYMDKLSPPEPDTFDLYFKISYKDLFSVNYEYFFDIPVNRLEQKLLMDIANESYK